jgi:ABC-type Fe3+/spermidine/putrescine transport system ATPase subunit
MTALHVSKLTKRYADGEPAVRDLSLNIGSGDLVGFLGPSGCGKTTTLKMIAGLVNPSSGDITFDGVSVLDVPPEKRGAVMVFQNHLLFPYMSVIENVGFGLRMRKLPASVTRDRSAAMLAAVHLDSLANRKPGELSGGQQQRVALARALVTEPKVLLLDEPLSNLDAHLRYEMRELILKLQRSLGITTIFVTHDQQEAVLLADRIAVIFDGVLQQYGTPRELFDRPVSERVARFFGAENFFEGTKLGIQVNTPIGTLFVNGSAAPDGPVLVSIRPESCELGGAAANNVFDGRVKEMVYQGTNTRLWLDVNGVELQLLCAPHVEARVGEQVRVQLPTERLVVVPRDRRDE